MSWSTWFKLLFNPFYSLPFQLQLPLISVINLWVKVEIQSEGQKVQNRFLYHWFPFSSCLTENLSSVTKTRITSLTLQLLSVLACRVTLQPR